MTNSPSEEETRRQLEELLSKGKAKVPDHAAAKDLIGKIVNILLVTAPAPPDPNILKLTTQAMSDEVNRIKKEFYTITDASPLHEAYKGDMLLLVLTSIFEDIVQGHNLPLHLVPSLVQHGQTMLKHNFTTETIERVSRNPDPQAGPTT